MRARAIRSRRINHTARCEDVECGSRASNVSGITVGEEQTIQPIYTARAEIWPERPIKRPLRSSVKEPVDARSSDVNRRSTSKVQRGDLNPGATWPMRLVEIEVAAREPGKQMHEAENKLSKEPVRVVENNAQRGAKECAHD